MKFEEKLKKLSKIIDDVVDISKGEAINAINAELNYRIFNKGLATDNNLIGTYSESTKKKKIKDGKKKLLVNLIDTTSLSKSLVVKEQKLQFKNNYGEKVSNYSELNFKKRIFAPTKSEAKIWKDTLNENLNKVFNDIGI